jgi:5'-3' exonuclease
MILVDFNPVVFRSVMANLATKAISSSEIDEGLVRHLILNSIRAVRSKFKHDYGELIVVCDSMNYWRKAMFPYYKANRKKARDDSQLDWSKLFVYFNTVKAELKEVLPYRMLEVETAEADDIIAHLCVLFGPSEQIMIVSSDKDFVQLHNDNVKQWDPINKEMVTSKEKDFLTKHILNGDKSDGIPNYLSDDDCFVINKRQTPLTAKRIEEWVSGKVEDSRLLRNFARNRALIDLSQIPNTLKDSIKEVYDQKEAISDRGNLLKYCMKHRLSMVAQNINDF